MSTEELRETPIDRWRLHRGGIVNIWQYAEHTFDLSGGRAIFQGTNGSGKSRTLELLLPLCLDGDLRQVGSKGFDTVSIRRLMLDEYPGGPNRIGYAWIELCRESPSGATEFLTCGVGVKASKSAQSITDSWRFITPLRVGIDVHLVAADRVPLGAAQLREVLGAEAVVDDQTFRARIAATVYGVPTARYSDLLHLQRTLRNPDVGLKVLEGQLEQILSDALPPLDPALIERIAGSFDDLESIRENILRLATADKALGEFLTTYSGYAFATLRDRAEAMTEADRRLAALRQELTNLDDQVEANDQERDAAGQSVADLEKREGELESSIDALRSHPAYAELRNLRDRQRLVDSARSAAVSALDTASRHRAQEDRSAETVVGALRRLSGDAEAAQHAADRARQQLTAAGLDSNMIPLPPAVPAEPATASPDEVRASPEPDAPPLAIERQLAPSVDADALAESLYAVIRESERAAASAKQRAALTFSLHQQAVELDTEQGQISDLQRRARQASLTATEASGRRNQAQQELADTASVWLERVRAWCQRCPMSPSDELTLPDAERLTEQSVSRQLREQAREWVRPLLTEVRQHAAEAQRELSELRQRCAGKETELAELRGSQPETATDSGGAVFAHLVDFAPSLDDQRRAGLEAALEASGLLTAWVSADDAAGDSAELRAEPGTPHSGATLADLLVPAPEPGCPVSQQRIRALLASVPVEENPGFAVTVTGRWHAGVLHGSRHKDTAEFVGAGARASARNRRIAELEDELAELRTAIGHAEDARHAAAERVTGVEQYLDAFPDDAELLTAQAKLTSTAETAQDAEHMASRLRAQHEQVDERGRAARAELVRSAAAADLPADSQALEAAQRAATEAATAIEMLREAIEYRCLPTLADVRGLCLHHDAAVADRMEAESQAEQHCAEYTAQAAALEELTAAVDGEAEQIAGSITGMEQERQEVRERLPRLREEHGRLRESGARLEAQRDNKRAHLASRESAVDTARTEFANTVGIPGLWPATGLSDEPPADLDEAARVLASADQKRHTESTVLNRMQALQGALSGNYDVAAGERHGVRTVTVTGEDGPRPVAEAARQVTQRLAQQRDYLNERYQAIFADYLIHDLADRLHDQITVADDLCARMNTVLDGARSSQGVHVQLEWRPSAALSDDIRQAIELVRTPLAERTEDQDRLLRRVFTELIEAERDSASGGYAEILARALDYRSWFDFTVRVRDVGPEGTPRVRRLRQLSSGETRLVSYVTLFAAAAAFYDAVSVSSERQGGPLRLVLLDEAFERLDDPTVARMLGLLVDLDMDWLITWPSGWGVSPKIPKMHIYDVLRPRSGHGIACTHTIWNGADLDRKD